MREISANTIGKKPDPNPSDQKLPDKKRRDLLRGERIRKFREQLGVFEHGDFRPVRIRKPNSLITYLLETASWG